MKPFLLFLSSIILLTACKKNQNTPDSTPQVSTVVDCALDTTRFDRILQGPDEYIDVIQDRGKRIVAITQNRIERYDMNGYLEWTRPLLQAGTKQNLIQADNDNYFVTAATRQIDDFKSNEFYDPNSPKGRELRLTHYYRGWGYLSDSCEGAYQLVSKSVNDTPDVYVNRPTPPVNNSICTLFKLNHQGNLVWTKSFKGNLLNGKSLAKSPDGNWFLLTYQSSGFYQKVTFDVNGVFQDTIDVPCTENSVTLYKFNSEGAVLWEKKLTDIYQSNYYSPGENPVIASLAVTSNHICIQTENDFIVLDQYGKQVQRRRAGVFSCSATARSVTSQGDLFYSIGLDVVDHLSKPYLQVSHSNGDVLSHTFPEELFINYKIYATTGGLILNDGLVVAKYSTSGTKLWSVPGAWLPGSHNISCITPTCSGGVILFKKSSNGRSELIKTDANGKYK